MQKLGLDDNSGVSDPFDVSSKTKKLEILADSSVLSSASVKIESAANIEPYHSLLLEVEELSAHFEIPTIDIASASAACNFIDANPQNHMSIADMYSKEINISTQQFDSLLNPLIVAYPAVSDLYSEVSTAISESWSTLLDIEDPFEEYFDIDRKAHLKEFFDEFDVHSTDYDWLNAEIEFDETEFAKIAPAIFIAENLLVKPGKTESDIIAEPRKKFKFPRKVIKNITLVLELISAGMAVTLGGISIAKAIADFNPSQNSSSSNGMTARIKEVQYNDSGNPYKEVVTETAISIDVLRMLEESYPELSSQEIIDKLNEAGKDLINLILEN